MRRPFILIGLTVVLVAAIVFTSVVARRQKAAENPAEAEEVQAEERVEISLVEPAAVRDIELVSAERRLRLHKTDGGWRLDHPDPIEIDPTAVEDLVYTFARLPAEKVIDPNPENLAQFGLDPPKIVGRATLADGSVIELRLGELTAAGNTYYLMKAGDPAVYTVWANHGLHLSYSPDDLRNKDLPRIAKQNIQHLKISRRGDRTIEMQQVDESMSKRYPFLQSRYVLTSPYRGLQPVSMEKLSLFLNRVPVQLKISRFVDDHPQDLSTYGLDPPRAEVIIENPDTELCLLIGDRNNESLVYARRGEGGSVFALESSDLEFLEVEPYDIIEKFAFIPFIDHVDRIDLRIAEESHRIELIRGDETPNAALTYLVDGAAVETTAFKELYRSLVGLVVEAEAPSPPSKQGKAVLELIYTLNRGEPLVYHLEFLPYDQDFLAVFKNDIAEFLISRQQVAMLLREVRVFLQALSN